MRSVYIHIPFCDNICYYCDFSKIFYNNNLVNKYLETLEKEIKYSYKNDIVKSIYIGGGTPSSLSVKQLKKLLEITNIFNKDKTCEFTLECNPENMTLEKIKLLKAFGVNRVSVGVQSFDDNFLSLLGRKHNKKDVFKLVEKLKNNNINNINIDLIFGIKNQTIENIRSDILSFLKLDIPHISYYSLILEEHTKLYIDNYTEIDDDECAIQYEFICKLLKKYNYNHYEISNFARKDYESKHNLTYWNNEEYYGFGCGAASFVENVRYENTKSITKYINGNYKLKEEQMNLKVNMENEIMLGLRKTEGIDLTNFKNKYNIEFKNVFNIQSLISNKMLVINKDKLFIPENKLFISNEIILEIFREMKYYDRSNR